MNQWQTGIHKGRIKCPSCDGMGIVEGYPCLVCEGEGGADVGCGAMAQVDRQYSLAQCSSCGMVPVEEVEQR